MLHGRMLRYLDEIARAGSIRKAATRLNVAASAINRQLLALEEDFGVPIFERMPRGLRLTAAGEMLIMHVRQTLKEHERLLVRVNALQGLQHGTVTLAIMSGLTGDALARVISQFQAEYPFIRLVVRILSLEQALTAVLAGEVDLLLAFNIPRHAQLHVLSSLRTPLQAAMAPDHPLGGKRKLHLADCLAYPLVMAAKGTTIRDMIEPLLPTDTTMKLAVETNSTDLLRNVAKTSRYITFLNEFDCEDDLKRGDLVLVPVAELEQIPQRLSLLRRLSGASDSIIDLVARRISLALDSRGKPGA